MFFTVVVAIAVVPVSVLLLPLCNICPFAFSISRICLVFIAKVVRSERKGGALEKVAPQEDGRGEELGKLTCSGCKF